MNHQEIGTTTTTTTTDVTTTTPPSTLHQTLMSILNREAFRDEYLKFAKRWDVEEMKICIDRGISVGIRNAKGWNALHMAVAGVFDPDDDNDKRSTDYDFNDIVDYLVNDCKIDPNVLTNDRSSVLHLAIGLVGRFDYVECLVYNYPSINIHTPNMNGQDALHLLLSYKKGTYVSIEHEYDYTHIMKHLIDTRKINFYANDNKGRHSLHYACMNGHLHMAKRLIDNFDEENIRQQDSEGFTVLHAAVINQNYEIVRYLIDDNRMDVDILDNMGYSALHWSIMNYNSTCEESLNIVKCLIDDGHADMTFTTGDGTMLMAMDLVRDNTMARSDVNLNSFLLETRPRPMEN